MLMMMVVFALSIAGQLYREDDYDDKTSKAG